MLETLVSESHSRDQALLALVASSWDLSSARSMLTRCRLSVRALPNVVVSPLAGTEQVDLLASSSAAVEPESTATARTACQASPQSDVAPANDGGIEQPQVEPEPILTLRGEMAMPASSSTDTPRNPWNAFQKRMANCGLTKQQMLNLYKEEKAAYQQLKNPDA